MKYLSIFFVILFWLISTVSANDEETWPTHDITDVKYSWNLDAWTKIFISWKNLNECSPILINSRFLWQWETTFIYQENENNWVVSVLCNDRKIQYTFGFPVISSMSYELEKNHIFFEIIWENFSKESKVYFWWTDFEIDYINNTKILWKLSWNFSDDKIYIDSEWLKSPLFKSDFQIPKITKIESEKWFIAWSNIKIYGENIDEYVLYIEDEKVDNIEKQTDYFSYTLPNKLGTHEFYFEKNWVQSNTVSIDIQNKKVFIEKYIEKTSSDSETWKVLEILGKNFPYYDEDIEVFLNGKKQEIQNVWKETLTVNDFEFNDGLNEIYVVTNKLRSNSLFYYNEVRLPYVSSITDTEFNDTQRILTIWVVWLDKDKDTILVDGKKTTVLWCYSSSCRIALKKSHVKWVISVQRNNLVHENTFKFDFTLGSQPYIEKIKFDETPQWFTKFTITGRNFLWSNISWKNIFQKEDDKLDIDISNETIKWRLPRDFSANSLSVNVEKYWLKSDLSFTLEELSNNTVKNAPFITEIRPENNIFTKYWDTVKIRWYGFNKGDTLFIGTEKFLLDFSEWDSYPKFILDKKISSWFYDIYVKNVNGKESNKVNTYISENNTPKFDFEIQKNTELFIENSSSKYPIFFTKFKNGITDVKLSQMKFKVHGKNIQWFWAIDLYIWNTFIETKNVDENGIVTFNYPVEFDSPNFDHQIILKKNGYFYNTWTFQVELLLDQLHFINNWTKEFIPNIALYGNAFVVEQRKFYNCYIEKSKNVACAEDQDDTSEKTSPDPIITKESSTNQSQDWKSDKADQPLNSNEVMMKKIDAVVEKLYLKKKNSSTHSQLIYFKNLKIKIQRIIDKLPDNHKQKQTIIYLHDSIDKKYKVIFKQYVLELKK